MSTNHPDDGIRLVHRLGILVLLAVMYPGCTKTEANQGSTGTMLHGLVFEDENDNGVRDEKEKGLARVRVSNGRDVILTDVRGRWNLEAHPGDTIFVIKPRHWAPPLDENGLPSFYYVHNPDGSPEGLRYEGVEPTPAQPGSIDFPMMRHPEEGPFKLILMGDPQSRNLTEVDYLARDVVEPMVGSDADFGIGLGDIVFDGLDILPAHNAVMGRTGIPWFNVHGNHDMNYDVPDDSLADETWQRIYGPPTYSFDWGTAHFIVIDDVIYDGDKNYHGGFTSDILEFIEADLKHIGKQTLVVLVMHVPLSGTSNADDLLRLLSGRPNTVSISSHYHMQRHEFLEFPDELDQEEPHHHLIAGTACGSWWSGEPDEYGIPHAAMQCGAPNGHLVMEIDDFDYQLRFVPARMDPGEQMHIFMPGSIPMVSLDSTEVVANVWAGSSRSKVRMRIDEGPWITMRHDARPDPYFEMARFGETMDRKPRGRSLGEARISDHIWVAMLPSSLGPGGHVVEVESTDMFGQVDTGHRIFRVSPGTREQP